MRRKISNKKAWLSVLN